MGTLLYKIKSNWNRCLFERETVMLCVLYSVCNIYILIVVGILCRYYDTSTEKCIAP